MSLDNGLMTYVHEEVVDFESEGNYIIISEESIDYEGKGLLVIERIHRLTEIFSILVPGFLEETFYSENKEKISQVTPISSNQRENVSRFLRRKELLGKWDIYFFNNEIEIGRKESSYSPPPVRRVK